MVGIKMIKSGNLQYFSIKSYVVNVYQNRLGEAILIHIHDIWFYGDFIITEIKHWPLMETLRVRKPSRNIMLWYSLLLDSDISLGSVFCFSLQIIFRSVTVITFS